MRETFLRRRDLFILAAQAGVGAAFAQVPAQATGKLVRILVGFPPGQATDAVARMLADKLRNVTGHSYIVENRPGQGGSLAMGQLATSANDGSVMMLTHMSAVAATPHLYTRVPYDTLKDFEAVGLVGDLPFVLACHPGLPVNNVQELIRLAKSRPGKLSNASSGNGTVSHLAMEDFKRRAGVDILHVPYRGSGPGLLDVTAGNVSIALETAVAVRPLAEGGRLRVLAVGCRQRLQGIYSSIPTLVEEGFDSFNAVTWLMTMYPKGTPASVLQSTFDAVNQIVQHPENEQHLLKLGVLPRLSTSTAEAMAYVGSEYQYWGEAVKRSGVVPE